MEKINPIIGAINYCLLKRDKIETVISDGGKKEIVALDVTVLNFKKDDTINQVFYTAELLSPSEYCIFSLVEPYDFPELLIDAERKTGIRVLFHPPENGVYLENFAVVLHRQYLPT